MTALEDVKLNDDFSWDSVFFKDGSVLRNFNIIHAVQSADVLINLCKLKSHSLTRMSAAIKNTFGTIPGLTTPPIPDSDPAQ